ncbi:MAG: 30S ribosomal protein S12 methylthiotransferase RimO [Firmicutes bacterium HGW-Firmicutes-1]|nr:MAG: 30S ribosomal protein S12 methylthiotransferase RimO [Firmicutes bacterium HGW-Firmicutes-1]
MSVKIFYVSLGCDKNLVDSEVMLGMMNEEGYVITSEELEADIIIVNTCSFIHDAKEESIETILEMAEYKETGNCKGLIVVGCLTERYKDELLAEMPEVDGILGTSNYDEIVTTIKKVLDKEKVSSFKDINYSPEAYLKRMSSTTTAYAYLKIAEGCNNNCTYCIIPQLRGNIRSRHIESLVEEAKHLVKQGKKEIILVAQDTTKYGIDLYKEKKLPELINELCKIEGLEWIRLLYCYPEDITDELIEVMKIQDKVMKYIDIPIQHINDSILSNMARKSNKRTIINVITRLRNQIPNICIRSSLIVGFPGETKEQFEELKDFVKEYKIDRLGVFTYSLEEGTKAATMKGQIKEAVKKSRKKELMLAQQNISLEKNKSMVGATLDIMIEGYLPDDKIYCGRSYMDAPNVDGVVFVGCEYELLTGQIVKVQVNEASEYDLIGEIKDEYSK